MGTRSIIAIPEGDGWRGRYCHWDGYPHGVGRALVALVERDGIERVRRTLTEDNYSWSGLNLEQHDQRTLETATPDRDADYGTIEGQAYRWQTFENDGRFASIEGYGIAHRDGDPEAWILPDGDKWGTEWLYVLGDAGVLIGKVGWSDNSVTYLGIYRYDDLEIQWDKITEKGYSLTAA